MGHNPRVAVLSVHTSPMDQPGSGDSGGMNVYIRAVTERLAGRGIDIDVFTRCRGGDDHEVKPIGEGIRVVSIKAGPCEPIPKADIPRFLPEFLGGLLRIAHEDAQGYDVVHSHYWLSGWVGRAAKHALGAPLVSSFHTLGKVKNYSLARGERPEPAVRIAGEQAVIDESDRILAPTPSEASQLVGLYRADAEQIRIVPPGVDHELFVPRDRAQARAGLDLAGRRIALYVGRLQAHKGPDVAVSEVILSNIRVLAIDQAPKEKEGSSALVGRTVTLELKPDQTEMLARSRQSGTLSLALRSIADIKTVEKPEEPAERRGENLNVVRYGVASQQTVQK